MAYQTVNGSPLLGKEIKHDHAHTQNRPGWMIYRLPYTGLSATANAVPNMVHDKKAKNRNVVTMLGGAGQICLGPVREMWANRVVILQHSVSTE